MDRLLARNNVRGAVKECTNCELYKTGNGPVPWSSPIPVVDIGVIGEAPGKEEDARGVPFVGPSGQLLRRVLVAEGGDPDTYAFLNVVSCFPARTPTSKEVALCRGNLRLQMAHVQARYYLVLGGVAVSAFYPGIKISDIRGLWWRWGGGQGGRELGPWMMATWHPSAVLRNQMLMEGFRDDIARFLRGYEESVGQPGGTYHENDWKCLRCGKGEDDGIEVDVVDMLPYCSIHHPANVEKVRKASDVSVRKATGRKLAGPNTRGRR